MCLKAGDRAGVDAFHAAALAHGGRDNGAPGLRADYGPDYYAAFVTDPDGYRLEAHVGCPLELQPYGCAFAAAGAGYMQPGGGI